MREKNNMRYNKKRAPKFMCVGPGGIDCICCFPAPGSKKRRFVYRRAKRLRAQADWKTQET